MLPEESQHTSIRERVDYTSRLVRDGKATVSAEVESIITRLGSSAESWRSRLLKLNGSRLLGRFLAASRDRFRELAQLPQQDFWKISFRGF